MEAGSFDNVVRFGLTDPAELLLSGLTNEELGLAHGGGLEQLPIPHRWIRGGLVEQVEGRYRPGFAALYRRLCCDVAQSPQDIHDALQRESLLYAKATSEDQEVIRLDAAREYTMRLHWNRGSTIRVRPTLAHLLDATDIGLNVPCAMLRSPFPLCYFDLPDLPDHYVFTTTWGLRATWRLQGAFVHAIERGERRSMCITGIGETTGPTKDTVMTQLWFPIERPDMPLTELSPAPGHESDAATAHRLLGVIARTLLYMGLREARVVERRERTEALRGIARLPGLERRARIRAARGLMDYIDVGPEEDGAGECIGTSGRVMPAHMRRGHFHRYWTGEGRSTLAIRWLQPVLVNARRLTPKGSPPAPRDYRLS